MPDSNHYPNEQAAAEGLLADVCSILNGREIDYVVIGGWIPFLFSKGNISHPGTFDVDVLLNTSLRKESVIAALDQMVTERGYLRAPKNSFQIHKLMRVGKEELVFHVDFLHRKYADDTDSPTMQWGRYESIGTLGTDIIFKAREIIHYPMTAVLPEGTKVTVNVPFTTEIGFLSCKGRSVLNAKRTRDAFDIFLVIKQSRDVEALVRRCVELMGDPVFSMSIDKIAGHFMAFEKGSLDAAEWLIRVQPSLIEPFLVGENSRERATELAVQRAAEEISSVVTGFISKIQTIHLEGKSRIDRESERSK